MPEFTGDGFANALTGGTGADVLSGLGGADTLNGGDGDDVLYGHSNGASSAINVSVLANGFSQPVAAASTAADPGFLYVVEKTSGVIWRVDAGTGARTTFLDIPNNEFLANDERGVLGLAFHPDYAANGRFFVYLTDAEGDIQVREYTRSANPAVANTTSSLVIEIPKQTGFANHNGGWIGFSPVDGYLYIATGDGGSGGDPFNYAQNLDVLLGKIVRIDVDGDDFPGDAGRNYAIPDDNPFVGVAGADEIWMYGVRNPWRNAFDPRNGDFYIADVGQGAREEVNYFAAGTGAGANLGWRIMEGSIPYNPGPPGTPQPGDPSLISPVFDYDHALGRSITGGEVYIGNVASFVGQYVFADFITGRVWTYSAATGGVVRNGQLTGASMSNIVEFVTGTDGALYAIGVTGTIWRITPGAGAEDVADTLNGGAGNDVLIGHAGADMLDGGSGVDTAGYGLASSAATWTRSVSGAWTVTAGAEGADTLTGVEILDFSDRDVVLDNAQQSFSGNGTSDLMWRNSVDGQVATWEITGASFNSAAIAGAVGPEWVIQGTGDFSGDGRDDIVLRRDSDGMVVVWRNANWTTADFVGATPAEWRIEAIGDFNFDGRDDFIWRNVNDGTVVSWLMDGGVSTSQHVIGGAPLGWSIEAAADLNGDGRDDILWRHTDGTLARWTTDGVSQTSAAIIGVVPTEWQIAGTGDFDRDGRADILWRNTETGGVAIWRMDGNTQLAASMIGAAPLSWSIGDVGDYNGDGRDDIIWRNDDGALSLWIMNGFSVTSQTIIGVVPTEWGLI
ncbi:MAG: PQQ-dependent sugar dehydrogenase [Phycisphaerales bacterium]|nr:PQQ-dependent sugar dehydrogenase [Hyphomonadaceae bacterium]